MSRKRNYSDIRDEQYQAAMDNLAEGGTKKRSCEILGVSSNPVMERLIKEHVEGKERDKRLRAEKRKKPVLNTEVADWVTDYLSGSSLTDLVDRYYRSANVIKMHLAKHGAFMRVNGSTDPLKPEMLPEICAAESFSAGDMVWVAKYNCIGEIRAEYKGNYRVQLLEENNQQYTYQPAYELGCLSHLEELGVDIKSLGRHYVKGDEVKDMINKTMIAARKNERK